METRIAILGIIVSNREQSGLVNEVLHEFGDVILGRLGVPYKDKKVSIITIVVDAENDKINAISGKLGRISDVSVKTVFQKI